MRRILIGAAAAVAACNGTTGGALVRFDAYASGVPGAAEPFVVHGFEVRLTQATMHIGAVYADESPLATGAQSPICVAPGVYAAQVPGPVDVDLLRAAPQEFSVYGNGSSDVALSWQLWLTDGDVNAVNVTPVVSLQGVATRMTDGEAFPFGAVVSINDNRLPAASDPAQPGANPICKQRILLFGGVDVRFFEGGSLYVSVDPRPWFDLMTSVDFTALPLASDASCVGADPDVTVDPSAFGPPLCTARASDGGCFASSSADAEACPDASTPCAVARRCIPNSNFATGAGAQEGIELFEGIVTSGPAAYHLVYEAAEGGTP